VGAAGSNGSNGAVGATGPTGAVGAAGSNGSNGAVGATGPTGAVGAAGSNGSNGAVGATGPTGAVGAAGSNGSNGAVGATGPTGAAGSNGAAGATGATGPTGPNWGTIASTDILYGQGTATPTWSSDYTWTDATQTLGVGATAATAAITFGAPVTGASISQTAPTSDVAPTALTITAQGPFASASTNKSSAALNLKTVAPVSGGTAGAITAAPGGTTALQLGAASTDFLALGASPASAGYLRFPALATTPYIQFGTIPVLWGSGGQLEVGASSGFVTAIQSSAQIVLSPNGGAGGTSSISNTQFLYPSAAGFTITTGARAAGAAPLTLTAGAGAGGASSSVAGGALALNGGAAAVATSGTAAGTAGGPASLTGGPGAAGLGTNQNGGNGANVTIGSGAGGAATGSGTAGAPGTVIINVGTTAVTSYGLLGVGDVPSNVTVSGITGGTTTLSSAQYAARILRLSGTLTSASIVVFPNATGMWLVDIGGLAGVSGVNTLTFQSGTQTTTAITALVTNSNILLISTYGSNTISMNL